MSEPNERDRKLADRIHNCLHGPQNERRPLPDVIADYRLTLEREMHELGPCGQHPKMFWVSAEEEMRGLTMCTAEATRPDRKILYSGHCTVCEKNRLERAARS